MTNRIGPNLPEPNRGGGRSQNTPDSEKFGKEMKKVEKIEKVSEVELDKRNKRPFYQPPDEDEEEEEGKVKGETTPAPTPYETKFYEAPPPKRMMMTRQQQPQPQAESPPRPPLGFEDLASDQESSAATPAPPSFSSPPPLAAESENEELPQSKNFWGGVDIPYTKQAPPQIQERPNAQGGGTQQSSFQKDRTDEDAQQRPQDKTKNGEISGQPNKKARKEEIFPSVSSQKYAKGQEPKSWQAPPSSKDEEAKASPDSQKKKGGKEPLPPWTDQLAPEETEEEKTLPSWAKQLAPEETGEEKDLTSRQTPESKNKGKEEIPSAPWQSAPPSKKGKPEEKNQKEKEQESLWQPASPSGQKAKESSPWETPPPAKKGEKKPSSKDLPPWQPEAPLQVEGRPSVSSKEDGKKKEQAPSGWGEELEQPVIAPLPRDAKKKESFPSAKPVSKKEPEENIQPYTSAWLEEKPVGKDKEKKGRLWEEVEEGKPPANSQSQAAYAQDRESGGGKKKGKETGLESVQPPDPLPPPILEVARLAEMQAAPYLNPVTAALFAKMVGTIVFMASSTPGISRTEFILNTGAFVNSKFYNTSITIEKYASAPDSFNIRLTGSPEAVKILNNNIENLAAAFAVAYDNRKIAFRIGRIEASIASDRPLFRRKKESGSKDEESGDFERGK